MGRGERPKDEPLTPRRQPRRRSEPGEEPGLRTEQYLLELADDSQGFVFRKVPTKAHAAEADWEPVGEVSVSGDNPEGVVGALAAIATADLAASRLDQAITAELDWRDENS